MTWAAGSRFYYSKPEPAPNWDTRDIICSIANDGVTYQQCQLVVATTPVMQHLAYIVLTTDNPNADIQPSPYSIRYYMHKQPSPDNTITVSVQVDGGANRSITNAKELLSIIQIYHSSL